MHPLQAGTPRHPKGICVLALYRAAVLCDVKNITYANIDFATKTMRFNQIKSEGRSAHSHQW